TQTVTFRHQFSNPGAHSLSATLEVEDDIAADNTGYFATNVADELRVLIVDGRPSGRPFQRAGAFSAIALAPSALTLDPTLEPNRASATDEASDDFDFEYDPTLDAIRFLVAPEVVEAPDITAITDFSPYDTILLADVARLPAKTAEALAEFTAAGGGLLISAGRLSEAGFYNSWEYDDFPFLPARLAADLRVTEPGKTIHPSAQTLTHPALTTIADPVKSDFATTVVDSYRPQSIPESSLRSSSVGARLNNGDILLSSHQVGDGQVVLLSTPLDLSSGNLVTRQAFLPFLHELVYTLANPSAYELNLDPGWEINLALTGRKGKAIGEGLIGSYYDESSPATPAFVRHDPAIAFDWKNGAPAPGIPADRFRIEWTGSLIPPKSERYTFTADVDDRFELWIDGKRLAEFQNPSGRKKVSAKLEQGRRYDFRAVYRENTGEARARLYWEARNFPRAQIDSENFRTFSPSKDLTLNPEGTTYEVAGPGGRPRTATIANGEASNLLKLQGEISSGLYRLRVPDDQRAYFSAFLRSDGNEIPFTVRRDSAESQLTRLTESDYQFLANFITLATPQTLEELVGFLRGNQFGQELWKYLAVGAFLFLLIEVALSRWIAQSRRMGEEITIQFESKDAPTTAFREQLEKLGKLPTT
ncbi:MAG: PA14 domain-containing protein, partial [Verrucomicrobiota bacterium]